jgi:hypothetical protein
MFIQATVCRLFTHRTPPAHPFPYPFTIPDKNALILFILPPSPPPPPPPALNSSASLGIRFLRIAAVGVLVPPLSSLSFFAAVWDADAGTLLVGPILATAATLASAAVGGACEGAKEGSGLGSAGGAFEDVDSGPDPDSFNGEDLGFDDGVLLCFDGVRRCLPGDGDFVSFEGDSALPNGDFVNFEGDRKCLPFPFSFDPDGVWTCGGTGMRRCSPAPP